MTRSPGLNTSVGARIARGCAAVAVGALWLGVTVTLPADGAAVRPGDSPSPVVAAVASAVDAPSRALPRLSNATAVLTGPAGKQLHATLSEVQAFLAPAPSTADTEQDAAALLEAGPVTEQNNVKRTVAEANETLALATHLAEAAVLAPPAQAQRLLVGASLLDDAARATLSAAGREAPADEGVAVVLAKHSVPAWAKASATADELGAGLAPSFVGALCTGDAAVTIKESGAEPTASTSEEDLPEPVLLEGFPTFAGADATLVNDRANSLHSAAVSAGRLSYATDVVAARLNTATMRKNAQERQRLTRALQYAQPSGCAPAVVTSAGEAALFTGSKATATLTQARTVTAEALLATAVSVEGEARAVLLKQWWAQRPVA